MTAPEAIQENSTALREPTTYLIHEVPESWIVNEDDYVYTPEGEFMGVVVPADFGQAPKMDADYAEWVLARIQKWAAKDVAARRRLGSAEAIMEGILLQAQRAAMDSEEYIAAQAQKENSERILLESARHLRFFDLRYGPDLKDFVRRITKGTKQRNWKSPFGVLQLRKKAAHIEIKEKTDAVELAKLINAVYESDLGMTPVEIKEEVTKTALGSVVTPLMRLGALQSEIDRLKALTDLQETQIEGLAEASEELDKLQTELRTDPDASSRVDRLRTFIADYSSAFEFVPETDDLTIETGVK